MGEFELEEGRVLANCKAGELVGGVGGCRVNESSD